jgi:zinc protease
MNTYRTYLGLALVICLGACFPEALSGQVPETNEKASSTFKVMNHSKADPNTTLEAILDGYEKALGGKDAIKKIQTLEVHEQTTQETPAGRHVTKQDQFLKLPNKVRNVLTSEEGRVLLTVSDGENIWMQTPDGERLKGTTLNSEATQELNPLNILNLRTVFPRLTLIGSSTVQGKDVYVVDSPRSKDGVSLRLFFDAKTKLLVSDIVLTLVSGGFAIGEEEFGDFKEVNGVMFPFTIQSSVYDSHSTTTTKRVQIICNTPLADDLFFMSSKTHPSKLASRGTESTREGALSASQRIR